MSANAAERLTKRAEIIEMHSEIIHCNVFGRKVPLRVSPLLFRPTLTTSILTEQLASDSVENRTVLDLGCGVGPIAIGLALIGAAHVYATDAMALACEFAQANASLNQVADKISFLHGNLFEPVRGLTFDVIVNDVSGVAEEVARLSSWFPLGVPSGGHDGTVHTVNMLRASERHLKSDGFLLFPVLSLSRQSRVLEVARDIYGDRLVLVASRRIPFSTELKSNMRTLEKLRERGLIEFWQTRTRPFWSLRIYKAYASKPDA